jgi:hypothetical protein
LWIICIFTCVSLKVVNRANTEGVKL